MSQNGIFNISDEQKAFNQIEILNGAVKDIKAQIKKNLDNDNRYTTILKREEELKSEFEDRLNAIKEEKKSIVEEFKATEELLYIKLDNLKTQVEGRKEALVQCFLRNLKAEVPTVIYKEKSNGKKNRVEINLNPKVKVIKWTFVSDEELLKFAEQATIKLLAEEK